VSSALAGKAKIAFVVLRHSLFSKQPRLHRVYFYRYQSCAEMLATLSKDDMKMRMYGLKALLFNQQLIDIRCSVHSYIGLLLIKTFGCSG
jgi:hypothetical protein